jgi:hypothetical protein
VNPHSRVRATSSRTLEIQGLAGRRFPHRGRVGGPEGVVVHSYGSTRRRQPRGDLSPGKGCPARAHDRTADGNGGHRRCVL